MAKPETKPLLGDVVEEAAENQLGQTVKAMRPMVPAKDFVTSRRFYEEL